MNLTRSVPLVPRSSLPPQPELEWMVYLIIILSFRASGRSTREWKRKAKAFELGLFGAARTWTIKRGRKKSKKRKERCKQLFFVLGWGHIIRPFLTKQLGLFQNTWASPLLCPHYSCSTALLWATEHLNTCWRWILIRQMRMGEMGTQISYMMRISVGRESQRRYLMCATKRAEKSLVNLKTTKSEALKKSSFHSITYYIFNILFMSSSAARSSNLTALSGLGV